MFKKLNLNVQPFFEKHVFKKICDFLMKPATFGQDMD